MYLNYLYKGIYYLIIYIYKIKKGYKNFKIVFQILQLQIIVKVYL
jgi:hypothetical protein